MVVGSDTQVAQRGTHHEADSCGFGEAWLRGILCTCGGEWSLTSGQIRYSSIGVFTKIALWRSRRYRCCKCLGKCTRVWVIQPYNVWVRRCADDLRLEILNSVGDREFCISLICQYPLLLRRNNQIRTPGMPMIRGPCFHWYLLKFGSPLAFRKHWQQNSLA
jgi:hypothetical protein